MSNHLLHNIWIKRLIVLVSGLLVTAIFFRVSLLSDGILGFGDAYDGLIAFSIIHHWYNVFQGVEHWRDLNYFYPYKDTLGYNDGYFLYGIFYSLIRLSKINPFLALEWVNVSIRLVGFYSFFYLCYRQLGLKFFICLLMATIFSLSNAVYCEAGHAQIFSVSFAPLLTIFLINYARRLFVIPDIPRAVLWGSISGIFYTSWLMSTYYMAWFYGLFAFFYLIFILIMRHKYKQLDIKKPAWVAIFIPFLLTLLALIPFLMVYLPSAYQTGMRGFGEVTSYTPTIFNLINVGNENLLWGRLLSYFPFQQGEFLVGYPLIFLAVLITAIVISIKAIHSDEINFYRPLAYAIIVSIFISILIISKISLWDIIWALFPGARGVRVVARYWIYLVFPMSVLMTYYLSKKMIWYPIWVCFLIPALLILEQINMMGVSGLNARIEQDFIDSVKPIPKQCSVFFVTGTRYEEIAQGPVKYYLNNVDAMVIAEVFGLKTINGMSSFWPSDWNFKYFPKETYLDRIKEYESKHNIENLCFFSIQERKWYLSQ
jgi:hypothetical protein